MRLPWHKTISQQLDLLGDVPVDDNVSSAREVRALPGTRSTKGRPATVPIESIDEDPANPRADFSDVELDDLAEDIRLRGILVPLVVHPANADGRHLLHFGARRLRAAMRAGLHEVPVVVRDAPADRYAQVAENLKRSDLAPLDLARFIRQQMDAGDSQAEVSRRLGMNLTTVAHHLSLLDLPPVLADAMKSEAACERLERLLARIKPPTDAESLANLAALRARVSALSKHLPQGSDRQTPSQAEP